MYLLTATQDRIYVMLKLYKKFLLNRFFAKL